MTEVTYHCINFNDRVRKVPKKIQDDYYLNFWNFSDPTVEDLLLFTDKTFTRLDCIYE